MKIVRIQLPTRQQWSSFLENVQEVDDTNPEDCTSSCQALYCVIMSGHCFFYQPIKSYVVDDLELLLEHSNEDIVKRVVRFYDINGIKPAAWIGERNSDE